MTGVGISLRARLGLLLVPVVGALGSCGGAARSTRHDESAGAAAASSGGSSTAGSSAAGGMGRAGTAASSAGTPGASMGGASGIGTGGVAQGGAADGGSSAGAGGESHCVDVCAHGPTCCVPACVTADARCVIDVFDTMLSSGIHEYGDLEQTVASLSQSFLASVSTADIVWAGAEPSAAGRIEMHLSPAASALYGAELEGADMHAFRLSCDGQSLFVGQVYMQNGAAALDTPVLHVARDVDDKVILRLGAQQGAWALSSTSPLAARERLDRPELRATLCLAGALPPL